MHHKKGPTAGTMATGMASALETRIREGVFPSGRALPSERELSVEFQVSRGVVRAAIEELAKSGMIIQRPNHRPIVSDIRRLQAAGTKNLGAWLWPNSSHFSAASILKGVQSTNLG